MHICTVKIVAGATMEESVTITNMLLDHYSDATASLDILEPVAMVYTLNMAIWKYQFFKLILVCNVLNGLVYILVRIPQCETDDDCLNDGNCVRELSSEIPFCLNCAPGYTGPLCDCKLLRSRGNLYLYVSVCTQIYV